MKKSISILFCLFMFPLFINTSQVNAQVPSIKHCEQLEPTAARPACEAAALGQSPIQGESPTVTDGMPSCAATSPDFVDNGVCDGSAGSAPMSGDTSGTLPTADNSAAPINEGRDMDVGSHRAAPIGDAEESGGPAAQHMNREINDGGFERTQASTLLKLGTEADRCKDTLNKIDVSARGGRCVSVPKLKPRRAGALDQICPSRVMWHDKYGADDLNHIDICRDTYKKLNNVPCSTALESLMKMGLTFFNGESFDVSVTGRNCDKKDGAVNYMCARGYTLGGAAKNYGFSASIYAGANPQWPTEPHLGYEAILEKEWYSGTDVLSLNRAWGDARDACGF
jgi:hypothetical protein